MNQSNAKDYLPLVQALADGRVIQRRDCGNDWADASELDFTWAPDRYRIKPEPREWWMIEITRDGICVGRYTFFLLAEAEQFSRDTGGELIHVREVLPQ